VSGKAVAAVDVRSLWWEDGALHLLDQRALPWRIQVRVCRTPGEVAEAIRQLVVRGAPAIGAAAAYGLALAAREAAQAGLPVQEAVAVVREAARRLGSARPTAVNLFRAVDDLVALAEGTEWPGAAELAAALLERAHRLAEADADLCRRIARHGADLLPEAGGVLTHCNTGALATCGAGTALGVLREALRRGKRLRIYACEARPVLQGARLTTWELLQEGIPVTLIVDGAAGYVMRRGLVDAVVVGADRVAANGDVVNKIGTYALAVLAREHGIPFYCAVPSTTLDLSLPSGDLVPIEERDAREVTHVLGQRVAPEGVDVFNPAFDVTPARYVAALITERGVLRPPLDQALRAFLAPAATGRRPS